MKTVWRGVKALLLVALGTAVSVAQSDRQAIDHYEARFEKYLGKEITVMVAEATREDTGEHADVAVFSIYTRGQREAGFTRAVVPRSEVDSFARRYSFRDYYQTRPLRGTFVQTPSGSFYISVNGAKFPEQEFAYAEQEDSAPKQPEELKLPAHDDSPMASFSYDGQRLVEARIVEITPSIVKLSDKNGLSLQVPIERAVKMPDLRMKAKAALEAAHAANSDGMADSIAR